MCGSAYTEARELQTFLLTTPLLSLLVNTHVVSLIKVATDCYLMDR